jgi:DNA-binding GntR family transcriptional regulator
MTDDRSPPVIAERIRDAIRAGSIPSGSHLGAAEVAEQFGVSRGPVREALRLLESAGLVRIVPQKGAFVVAPGDDEVRELLSIREVLFAALAQRCTERATAADLAALARAVDDLAALAAKSDCTAREFQRMTDRFVARMYRIASMPRLIRMIQDLSSGPGETWGHLAVATREMRLAELRAYQRLLRAIRSRDAQAAFETARAMHSEGVTRAIELNQIIRSPGTGAPLELKRSRRRGAAGLPRVINVSR